jgi:ribosomal protein L11 methyltransferase
MGTWFALVVDGLARRRFTGVSSALFSLGAAGVAEEGDEGVEPAPRQPWDTGPTPPPPSTVRLRAWFEAPTTTLRAAAEARLPRTARARWEPVAEQDWSTSWQAHFPTLHIGPLTVAPPWEATPEALVIEPGQGFGTGQHTTTRQVLEALVPRLLGSAASTRVLDVGCGSGILALAAAKLGAVAYGVDHDPVAVDDARGQAAANGLDVPFDTTPIEDVPGVWTIVVANLFAETLIALAEPLVARTGEDLLLAGILADREPGVRDAFDRRLGAPTRYVDGEWICLHYTAPSATRTAPT